MGFCSLGHCGENSELQEDARMMLKYMPNVVIEMSDFNESYFNESDFNESYFNEFDFNESHSNESHSNEGVTACVI